MIYSASVWGVRARTNLPALKSPLCTFRVYEDRENPRFVSGALALPVVLVHSIARLRIRILRVRCGLSPSVYQVLKLTTPQLRALDTKNERNRVHEVGLARAIRPNDRGKVLERSDSLVAPVQR